MRGCGVHGNSKGPTARSGIRPQSTGVEPSTGTGTPANGDTVEETAARSGFLWPKVALDTPALVAEWVMPLAAVQAGQGSFPVWVEA